MTQDLWERALSAKARGLHTIGFSKQKPHIRINVHHVEQLVSWSGGFYESGGSRKRGFSKQAGWNYFLRTLRAVAIMTHARPRITRLDYKDVLEQCGEGDLVYVDPPYKNHDMSAAYPQIDHRELVKQLLKARYRWVLSESGDPVDPVYYPLGEPLARIDVRRTMTSMRNPQGTWLTTKEALWTNYQPPVLPSGMPKNLNLATLLEQLNRQRDDADAAIRALTNASRTLGPTVGPKSHHKKQAATSFNVRKPLSAEARERIAAAQRKRWAKVKKAKA
jgi:hypothetical protein